MVMGVTLLAWVVSCGVMAVRRLRSSASRSGLVAQATCGTCGARFDVDAAELARTFVSKSRSVTKTRCRGAALVDEPRYLRFAKKVWCPHCGAQRWANIENVNELNERLRPELMRVGIRCLLVMAVGGFIILGAASVQWVLPTVLPRLALKRRASSRGMRSWSTTIACGMPIDVGATRARVGAGCRPRWGSAVAAC